MRLLFAAAASLLLSSFPAAARTAVPQGFRAQANGMLVHKASGTEFPKELAGFTRVSASPLDGAGKDVTVSYRAMMGAAPVGARIALLHVAMTRPRDHFIAMKPLIGISCCTKLFGAFGMANHAASDTYIRATDRLVDGVPVLIPANGDTADVATLLARLDGIILTGSRSNVQPSLYDGPPHAEGTPEDAKRDAVTLPLIRAAVKLNTSKKTR